MTANPLLESSELRHGAVRFDLIRDEHFLPAVEAALGEARANIARIKGDLEPADFVNTIEALETCSGRLDRASGTFFNLLSADSSDARHALAKEISPKLADFANDIALDAQLFERVKAVHDRRAAGLDPERSMLLDKTYKHFVRNGALLNDEDKARLREIDRELSTLGPQFQENLLKATNDFELVITDRAGLAGLPESAIDAAAETARERNKPNAWVFTLHAPSYIPFLTYADDRAAREKLWRAYNCRSFGGAHDNRAGLMRIAGLRHQRANLLGYPTHAHFVLEERMAKDPQTVTAFLDRIRGVSVRAGERDLAELRAFKRELCGDAALEMWDMGYYTEKLKQKKFEFDQEMLRPYFRLERVIDGVFEHARRLYGLTFKPVDDLPVYHPDVRVYEVRDESGAYIGLFYADFFPRESKDGGAWMTTWQDRGLFDGTVREPHAAIVCNFTKPTAARPSLITYEEVETLFHEFGHSLHALLSKGRYTSLAGTRVYWDFVELPSQIMENWVKEKESLDIFAAHYETGERIPPELCGKIKESARFFAGHQSLRQLTFSYLDMAWHTQDPAGVADVDAFEREVIKPTTLMVRPAGVNISCSFAHIFAGGYSSGYYSYKWAEVLDADAFELFREKGLFNRDAAAAFRKHILEKGGSEHPMELYKRFRGREPDPDALLRRDGLI